MNEILSLMIGAVGLVLGVPMGNLLARLTEEELKDSRIYINWIVWTSLLIGFIGLIFSNDILIFSCFFISIVSSRSLIKLKKKK